jgi:hypothetical protein
MEASRSNKFQREVFQFAKAHRKSTGGNTSGKNQESDRSLKRNHLRPGAAMSVDHFESRLRGRTYTSFGKTTSDQYIRLLVRQLLINMLAVVSSLIMRAGSTFMLSINLDSPDPKPFELSKTMNSLHSVTV